MPPRRTAVKLAAAIVIAILYVLFWRLVMPPWPEENGANFLRALAEVFRSLQWPVVALIVATFFRQDIRKLLERMRSLKGPGIEGHFAEALDQLTESTKVSAEQAEVHVVEVLPEPDPTEIPSDDLNAQNERISAVLRARLYTYPAEQEIVRVAANSPRAALMLLSAEIDSAIRALAEIFDLPAQDAIFPGPIPTKAVLQQLVARGLVLPTELRTFDQFRRVRNAVVHEGKGNDDDVIRAIDSGLIILNSLLSQIPLKRIPNTYEPPNDGDKGNTNERSTE